MKNFFLALSFWFLAFNLAWAAEISITPASSVSPAVMVGQTVAVDVSIDTEGAELNAVEGALSFPPASLTLREIRDAQTVVSFWVKPPQSEVAGVISYAGLIPGGLMERHGRLFTLLFEAKKIGEAKIVIGQTKVFLNNGQGTAAPITTKNLALQLLPADLKANSQLSPDRQIPDSDPPEPFTPLLSRTPGVFDNQWFVVFATQDKGSGVAGYQIQETKSLTPLADQWRSAISPHRLTDQTLTSRIYIRALDRTGNERLAIWLPAINHSLRYLIWFGLGIILLALFILWRLFGKH